MSAVKDFVDVQLTNRVDDLLIHHQGKMKGMAEEGEALRITGIGDHHHGLCAICLDKIVLQDTAIVKGCEHAYCMTCILHWASYNENPKCPQCKHPFESLNVFRSLDGSIHDYMLEESIHLLLNATWFKPLVVEHHRDDFYNESEELELYRYQSHDYEDEDLDDDIDETYFSNSSSLRIGNRRWGDDGYIRSGHQEARPVNRSNIQVSGAGSSRDLKKKEVSTGAVGRRAKRALKREAADKAAAAKHQQHSDRSSRK